MIEHMFLKNYRAFKKETIVFDKHNLFTGTDSSGKTTILEALDLFFNNNLNYNCIRDVKSDIVIELYINDKRYRKVFSPPYYHINYDLSIGRMYEIADIKYLYIQQHNINYPKLINDIYNINHHVDFKNNKKIENLLDDIEITQKPVLFEQFKRTNFSFRNLRLTSDEITLLLKRITNQNTMIGIDVIENIHISSLNLDDYLQTFYTSKSKKHIEAYKYSVQALYKDDIISEVDTITKSGVSTHDKTMLLVEGKYDVAWFEKALKVLNKFDQYRVIPCGGSGNIKYVEEQLIKEGFKTITITDGDTLNNTALNKEIIELYADVNYINKRFNTSFSNIPKTKYEFFKRISVKDDVVKKVLSGWAKRHLTIDNQFVKEVKYFLEQKK